MIFLLSNEKLVSDIQFEFNLWFPNLRLDFLKQAGPVYRLSVQKYLDPSTSLKSAGMECPGILAIQEDATVEEFEDIILKKFGLFACVLRKYRDGWIETERTRSFSLKTQNAHGFQQAI
jgi:hypothetical protein